MEERLQTDNAWAAGTTETYPADEELAINVLDKYHLFKSCFIFELFRISLTFNKLFHSHSVTMFHFSQQKEA